MPTPSADIKYPFVPKSTLKLIPGQFWAVPLKDGRFACGRVIQLLEVNGRWDSILFLAGLQDWVSDCEPTDESIAGTSVLKQGMVAVDTIQATGRRVLGWRALELDAIGPEYFLSTKRLSLLLNDDRPEGQFMRGFDFVGFAPVPGKKLQPLECWGRKVIAAAAEQRFGGNKMKPVKLHRSTEKERRDRPQSLPVLYREIADKVSFELLVDDVQIVILKPQQESTANLLGFEPYNRSIWRIEPPEYRDDTRDGFVNLWIKRGQVWAASWRGYAARIDPKSGRVLQSYFTK